MPTSDWSDRADRNPATRRPHSGYCLRAHLVLFFRFWMNEQRAERERKEHDENRIDLEQQRGERANGDHGLRAALDVARTQVKRNIENNADNQRFETQKERMYPGQTASGKIERGQREHQKE